MEGKVGHFAGSGSPESVTQTHGNSPPSPTEPTRRLAEREKGGEGEPPEAGRWLKGREGGGKGGPVYLSVFFLPPPPPPSFHFEALPFIRERERERERVKVGREKKRWYIESSR